MLDQCTVFDSVHSVTNFETESLFKNIASEETFNTCVEKLFHGKAKLNNLLNDSMKSLMELAASDSFLFWMENTADI